MRNDVYILNSSFDRIDLIEQIHSFIWTIRYADYGDFVLKIPLARFPFNAIKVGNYVENPLSNRLMIIESIIKTQDSSSEGDLVEVTGRSIEAFFEERVVPPNTATDYWTMNQQISWVATELVRRICVVGSELSSSDIIPNLITQTGAISPIIEVKVKPTDLYRAVKGLCDEADLGFRIHFNRATKGFEFRIYSGTDRSSTQNERSEVIFSKDFDNLANSSFLQSNRGFKNVAYVTADDLIRVVTLSGTPSGMNRRVMMVDASDIKDPTNAKLDSRGRLALSQQKFTNLFDGEIENTKTYRYETDYEIGDIVSLKGDDGSLARVRITEFVTSFDLSNGVRRYPTFTNIT